MPSFVMKETCQSGGVIPMKMGIQIQKNLELDSRLRGNDRARNSRNCDCCISN